MLTVLNMRVSGKTINSMAKEWKNGQTMLNMKENILKEKNMEKDIYILLMEAILKEILYRTK